jgi:clan AA aspartic protease
MITGLVRGREARIRLKVLGTRKKVQEVEAVIDTGYTGRLTLPPAVIAALGLRWYGSVRGSLADGTTCLFNTYAARVVWDRRERRVLVHETDSTPLVGMRLLRGYELRMQVRFRGKVTIKRLPAQRTRARRSGR